MDLKILWILKLVIILKEASSEEEVICREPWTRIHRSCIFFNTTLTNQSEAAATCDTMGAYLFVFSNVVEHKGVVNETWRILLELQSMKHLEWWVGLEFDSETAKWHWVSDDEFNRRLTEWAPGRPQKEKCAVFDSTWLLKDDKCTMEHPFICEQNRSALTTTTAATTSSTTVAPATTTGEMVTVQKNTSGGPEISTERTGQPTTQHTTPDVGPNQTTRNHTDKPTEPPDVSNQTSGTLRPDSGSGSTQDPGVSTTGQPQIKLALQSKALGCGKFFGIAHNWSIQIITWYGDARCYPYVILNATTVAE